MASVKVHALDLDEICSLIAKFMTKVELANCLKVCQAWHHSFLPHYWHTILVSPHKLTRCHEESLLKYGSLVRSLSAGRIEDTSVFDQPSVCYLQNLEVTTIGSRTRHDCGRGCLPNIIYRNRETLHFLTWRCYGQNTLSRQPYQIHVDLFAGLKNLVTMELCNWSISSGDFVQLLCSCPSLKKLTLDAINGLEQAGDGEMHEQDGNNDLSNFLRNRSCNTASSFTHIGLDELTFIGRVVPRILPLVPNITHLIFKSLLNGDFHGLQHQINLSQCLTHITSLSMPTECVDPSEFMCLIRKIPRDQLAWFEGKVPVTLAQEFLRTIIQRQSQTIETLVILNGEDDRLYIGSRSSEEGDEEPFIVWKLFECSPQLITVVIPYNLQPVFSTFNTNDGEQPTLNVLQQQIYYLPAREWVCSELKRLYLRLKDMDRRHPMDQITFNLCVERLLPPDERRVDDNTKRSKTKTPLENMIMERLSSLHKLQSLNIGNGWFPLPKAYK